VSTPAAADGAPEGAAFVEVARVVRARGLRGELVLRTHAEDPEILLSVERLTLDGTLGAIPHRVLERRALRPLADGRCLVSVALAGVSNRGQAEAWVGAGVRVPAELLEAARGEDLYWRDLIGLQGWSADGRPLGRVREIWTRPIQDLLVIETPAGEQLLVPAAEELLERVDLQAGRLWVSLPELELDAETEPHAAESAPELRAESDPELCAESAPQPHALPEREGGGSA